ncbi:protein kinase [Streptomyces sp. NPDC048258]|uniref:protein kinase domain-containing protein n=1 Tax=Streptomyces sp. NPDC048258 TaxID=3365527 RepID=UPI003715C884
MTQAMEIVEQVLAALAVSHGRGLVHRDIKPPNVLLTEGGAVKVADFGIVRAAFGAGTALTGTHMMVGTPQYMSPEQVQGSASLDGRSDLYAVGVLLFEMLTGRVPFDGEDGFAVGYRHVMEEPPTLASYGIDGQPQLGPV